MCVYQEPTLLTRFIHSVAVSIVTTAGVLVGMALVGEIIRRAAAK